MWISKVHTQHFWITSEAVMILICLLGEVQNRKVQCKKPPTQDLNNNPFPYVMNFTFPKFNRRLEKTLIYLPIHHKNQRDS